MQKTNISWCTDTWNPGCGCPLPLLSKGCESCWARQLHNQRHIAKLAGKKLPNQYLKPFEEIQLFPDRLEEPLHARLPRIIAVNLMGDLFAYPFEFIDKVMAVIWECNCRELWHEFIILTKRLKVALEYYNSRPWPRVSDIMKIRFGRNWYGGRLVYPEHLTIGTSISNQQDMDKAKDLYKIPAARRTISFEPLLSDIDMNQGLCSCSSDCSEWGKCQGKKKFACYNLRYGKLDSIIIGAESKGNQPGRECKVEWIRSLVQQAGAAGVKVHVKQIHTVIGGGLSASTDPKRHAKRKAWTKYKLEKDPDKFPADLNRRDDI